MANERSERSSVSGSARASGRQAEKASDRSRDSASGPNAPVLPRHFGRYLLLRSLARGGMGEVFLARTEGLAGIQKLCIVKTLRAHLMQEPQLLRRFLDEARVVVQLSHKNICQVFDVGEEDGQHYMAMELIQGRDLRATLSACARAGTPLGVERAVFIGLEMLEGLDYAHRFADPVTGEPLCLVHRDVSPHNVMLSQEGEVKLIDFGIAASAVKELQTMPNIIVGKLAYMAPEQAAGAQIDQRADQFAAAIVLSEAATGERFYSGRDQGELISLVGRGTWRPAKLSRLPSELRDILEVALSPDPADRFPHCAAFRDAIADHVQRSGARADARALRAVMSGLFGEALLAQRDELARAMGVSLSLGAQPRTGATSAERSEERARAQPDATTGSRAASASRAQAPEQAKVAEDEDASKDAPGDAGRGEDAAGEEQTSQTVGAPAPPQTIAATVTYGRTDLLASESAGAFGEPSNVFAALSDVFTSVRKKRAGRARVAAAAFLVTLVVLGGLGAFLVGVGVVFDEDAPAPVAAVSSPDDERPTSATETPPAVPVDAAPADAAPVDAAPVDAPPVDAAPVDAAPVDAAPVDAAPIDVAPVDAAPEDDATARAEGALDGERQAASRAAPRPSAAKLKAMEPAQKLAWLKRTCPKAPCTRAVLARGERVASLSLEELVAFKNELDACALRCGR
jgi:tRNA A-37 threonylcarbamoyl transferase component Bud32